jgi:zinc transporter ZupT
MLLVTSGTTPLGIGIGLAVVSTLSAQALQLATAIILAMAAGSFAFIGLLELLPSALLDGRLVHVKLAVFGLGYTGMAILAAYK